MPDPCDIFRIPPGPFGWKSPAYKACKAGTDKASDVLVKDEHTTIGALVAEYWGANERTKEGQLARGVARGLIWAESGGDPDVKNPEPCSASGDHAVGLMQICTPMHMSEKDAQNPRKNLAKARQLYNAAGRSFARDWPTYRNGSYKGHENFNQSIVTDKKGIGDIVDGLPVIGEVKSVVDFLGNFLNPSFYARIGKGALGAVLIIVGVIGILLIALRPVSGAVTKVNKVGSLASKVGRPAMA